TREARAVDSSQFVGNTDPAIGIGSVWPSTITWCWPSSRRICATFDSTGVAAGFRSARPESNSTRSVSSRITRPRWAITVWTLDWMPFWRAYVSICRLSRRKSSCSLSRAAAAAAPRLRPPLCDRRALMGRSGDGQLGLCGGNLVRLRGAGALGIALCGRDEGQELVGHDARVVAGLDREDALERHRAQLDLL